jgi:energy-coupling factor transport system permease protein
MMNWLLVNIVSWALVIFGVAAPVYFILGAIGLTGFMEVTRFEKGVSFYYRMNPATKLSIVFAFTFMAAATIWWTGLIATIILLSTYVFLNNGRRKLVLGSLLTLTMVVGRTWAFGPYTPSIVLADVGLTTSTPVWTWPSYFAYMGYQPVLTVERLVYGMQVSMRFTCVLLIGLILVMSSTPSDILKALNKIGVPVTIVFMIVMAMRSIPRIFQTLDTSVKIQILRGRGAGANRLLKPAYLGMAAISSLIPVVVFLFRGATNMSISADTRAFRAYSKRTYTDPITFRRVDFAGLAVAGVIVVLTIIAMTLGFVRGVPFGVGF